MNHRAHSRGYYYEKLKDKEKGMKRMRKKAKKTLDDEEEPGLIKGKLKSELSLDELFALSSVSNPPAS